jgi:hypothetical protein
MFSGWPLLAGNALEDQGEHQPAYECGTDGHLGTISLLRERPLG